MRAIKYILILLYPILTFASTNRVEQLQSFRFENAHPQMVLNMYGAIVGKRIEVVEAINSHSFSFSAGRLTEKQILELIEDELEAEGIALFDIGNARMVATYSSPGPSIAEARKYLEHCKKTKEQPRLDALNKHVRECWVNVPKLKALVSKRKEQYQLIDDLLMENEAYQIAYRTWESCDDETRAGAYDALIKSRLAAVIVLREDSDSYKSIMKICDELECELHLLTLEYLIDEYEKKGLFFPVVGK